MGVVAEIQMRLSRIFIISVKVTELLKKYLFNKILSVKLIEYVSSDIIVSINWIIG